MTDTTNTQANLGTTATKQATSKPLIATKPVSAAQAGAAGIAIIAGALFAVLLLGLHILEPEFDPTWRFVSEYMLGSFGFLMHFAFFALATSMASVAVALRPHVRTWPGYIGLAVLAIAAIGILLAAIFTTDPAISSRSGATTTLSGTMHTFGASLDFTPVAALLLSWSLGRTTSWRPVRGRLWLAAALTFVVMVAFMATLPYDGKIGPGVMAGLVGRFLLLSYLGWFFVVAEHVLKLRRQDQ